MLTAALLMCWPGGRRGPIPKPANISFDQRERDSRPGAACPDDGTTLIAETRVPRL